jgi:chromosomal replication initiation ATPase DnaA
MGIMSNTAISNKHIKTYVNEVNEFINRKTKELEDKLAITNKGLESSMNFLAKEVCVIYKLHPIELKKARASSVCVEAQDIMINLMRKYSPYTAKEIVEYFGKKNEDDRVFKARKKHQNINLEISVDKFYYDAYSTIEKKFTEFLGVNIDK